MGETIRFRNECPILSVNVGIVGAGIISDIRARGYLSHPSAKIIAVCDIDETRAEAKARKWGTKKHYTDYRKMIRDEEINTIEILLPHALHASVAIEAMKNGKNVIVQKPMAMSVKQADEMIRAAEENGVKLGVCENYIRYPPIEKAAELISRGEIGTPVIIRIEKVAGVGGPEEWKEPNDPSDWRQQKNLHGGYIYDEIVHHSAVSTLLMGADVESVSATFENIDKADERPGVVSWKHVGGNKYGSLTYSFGKSKTRIPIMTNYYPVHEGYEVVGDRGILWITRCTGQLLNQPALMMFRDGSLSSWEDIEMDWGISFIRDVHNFVDDVINDRRPRMSGLDGKKHIKFAWAVYKAAETNRTVRLDEIN